MVSAKLRGDRILKEFNIEYQQPTDIQFNLTPEFDGKFVFPSTVPIGKKVADATIRQNCDVLIRPKEGVKNFKDLMDCFWGFWRFMNLSYSESPDIEEIMLGFMHYIMMTKKRRFFL